MEPFRKDGALVRRILRAMAYNLERAGVICVYLLFAWTPLAVAKAMATAVAEGWRLLESGRRRQATERVMRSLGLDRQAAERVVRENYRHLAYVAVEVARLARFGPSAIQTPIVSEGHAEEVRKILSRGRGLVMISGHLGNWECGCAGLGRYCGMKAVIARTRRGSYLHKTVNRLREKSGVAVWDQRGALRRGLAALRNGESFTAVIDEDVGSRGEMIPFLGRDASTFAQPIRLAMRTGSPILVVGLMRTGGLMRFDVERFEVHWPDPEADRSEEERRLLTAVNADLAAIVAKYPEQWHWRKNRWKTTDRIEARRRHSLNIG